MELSIYDVIKGPVVSDKAYKLNQRLRQLALKVHQDANKPLIREALKKLFGVDAKGVRTCVRRYPVGRSMARRNLGVQALKRVKIAYVTLAEGQSLELFEHAGVPAQVATEKNNIGKSE